MALIKIKKGVDLNLKGKITQNQVFDQAPSTLYAVIPDDFTGIIPRMDKKEGESVVAGADAK